MEVASLVIGIASLAAIAENVEETIRKIQDFCEAPAAFQILLDEVAALNAFVHDVEKIATENGTQQNIIITESFRISILRSKESLGQINNALEKCSKEGTTRVNRLRWVMKSNSLRNHTHQIRNARLEIIGALCIVLQYKNPVLPSTSSWNYQEANGKTIRTAATQTNRNLEGLIASSMRYFNSIQEHLHQTRTSSTFNDTTIQETNAIKFEPPFRLQTYSTLDPALLQGNNIARSSSAGSSSSTKADSNYIMVQKDDRPKTPLQTGQNLRHSTVCGCVCHKTYRFRTPKSLLNYLGAVFIAHSGFPWATRECSDPYCRQPAMPFGSLTYCLPSWLCNMVATCTVSYSSIPKLMIQVSRIVLAGNDVFKYVQDGNISRLRELFSRKEASPFDITATRGQSALQLAVALGQLHICEFLIAENADPYLEDWENTCAFDVAWDNILGNTVNEDSQKRLRELFSNTTRLEKRGFSKLHKAILNLLVLDIKEELNISSHAATNKQDEDGKTPLAWAALRGDHNSVKILLEHEGSLKISTNRGFTPLHFAVQSGNLPTVQHLLQHGADVDARNNNRECPLHLAARHHDNPELLKILLVFKAEQNSQEQFGYTPLICAVQEDNINNTAFLLESGAAVDIQDRRGFTALSFAIFLNRYKCMIHLLQSSADQTIISKRGRSFLHLVAMYADLDSLRILLKHLSPKLPPNQHKCDRGYTALDLAGNQRIATCEEWKSGFLRLLHLNEMATQSL